MKGAGERGDRPVQRFTDAYLAECARMSPDQVARWLDDYRKLVLGAAPAQPKKLISLRVDEPLLRL
ncbi:MAG TPA: hypothetical protein RMF84_14635, partial [Polyangiaceae bacterium LLY-WYZ-14_1]|nr:hypothetical protein [Polyangiaceae bacterium LLY-WYZ-14_1]